MHCSHIIVLMFYCRPLYSRRRGSINVLQPIGHSALGSVARETSDERAGESLCSDTAEASYKIGCITKELSDMVYYTEPVKFSGFKVK